MKYALIIGNTEYYDSKLAKLNAPSRDTEDFANVLRDKNIAAFDSVNVLLNKTEPVIREAIDEFFDQKKPDDLLVLYFSGHGIRDEFGSLFLAVKNTNSRRLRATAVKSDFVRESMDQSRSKRQILILDCCNSGAFPHGTKAATGISIGTSQAFQGYGRIILTASDSTEFAWEGDQIIGETNNSLFTHFLVKGLKGEADLDDDGRITVDELYDYTFDQVKMVTPKQNPLKFSSNQQGEIVLSQKNTFKHTSLNADLVTAMQSSITYVREGAVKQLEKLLESNNIELVLAAKEALQKISEEDDSRKVALLAKEALQAKDRIYDNSIPYNYKKENKKTTFPSTKKQGSKLLLGFSLATILTVGTILIVSIIIISSSWLFDQFKFPTVPTERVSVSSTTSISSTKAKTSTPNFVIPAIATPTFFTYLLEYCDVTEENFCIYSFSPQPSSLIVAIKYRNLEIDSRNLPQLIVDGNNFQCELLAAYPGRVYCEGETTVGETIFRLILEKNKLIYSGSFYIREYVAPAPTSKSGSGKKYP